MKGRVTIVVQTYNRLNFLPATLKSLCEQDYEDLSIRVFNNGGDGGVWSIVDDVAAAYPSRRCTCHGIRQNFGPDYYSAICDLVDGDWVILFHDDDLLHPHYVSAIMAELGRHPHAVQGGCLYTPSPRPEELPWFSGDPCVMTGDVRLLAATFVSTIPHSFQGAIYRADVFRESFVPAVMENMKQRLGKIHDRSMLMKFAGEGEVILLLNAYVHYRIHDGQDSRNATNGPYEKQIFELLREYRRCLCRGSKDDFDTCFRLNAENHLRAVATMNPTLKVNGSFLMRAMRFGALPCLTAFLIPYHFRKKWIYRHFRKRCRLCIDLNRASW